MLRSYGKKRLILPWLLPHLPEADTFVDAFGGTAAVLCGRPRSRQEIYGDIDPRLGAYFRTVQSPAGVRVLIRHLETVPRHAAAFDRAVDQLTRDPKDVLAFATFNQLKSMARPGQRTRVARGHVFHHQVSDAIWNWRGSALRGVAEHAERMRGVNVVTQDGVDTLHAWDGPDTLHYLDPPYLRFNHPYAYRYPFDAADHTRLLAAAAKAKGRVAISGYRSTLYDEALRGWRRFDSDHVHPRQPDRREVLWTNYDP